MKTTLLLEYKYPYGLINALWAAHDRYGHKPDRIILATTGEPTNHTRKLIAMLEAWQRGCNIDEQVVVLNLPDDAASMRDDLAATIRSEMAAGHQVAVDVTSGRTVPKLALYHAAVDAQPDHVFYLDVQSYDYRPQPYPLIPRRIQTCHDLDLEEIHARS